jgi:hypothetical protein
MSTTEAPPAVQLTSVALSTEDLDRVNRLAAAQPGLTGADVIRKALLLDELLLGESIKGSNIVIHKSDGSATRIDPSAA